MPRLFALIALLCLGVGLVAATLERLPIPPRSETWTHRRGVQTGLVVVILYPDKEARGPIFDSWCEGLEKNRQWSRNQSYFNFDIAWELYPAIAPGSWPTKSSAPVFPVFENIPAPTSNPNGTTEAANTVACFTGAGDYVLRVTVQDASGHTVTGDVEVRVDQTASAVQVDPD